MLVFQNFHKKNMLLLVSRTIACSLEHDEHPSITNRPTELLIVYIYIAMAALSYWEQISDIFIAQT